MTSAPAQVIFLITGIQAAGKSTIAQMLAERLPHSVHVRGDLFRRMVVNGRADMTPDPSPEAVLSGRRAWTGGEDAGHWRAEVEDLGSHLCEAGAPQQVLDFAGGAAGGVRRGAGAAGLGCDGDAPAG